ncbi:DinB family protein [Ramlibacter tataouinensis]|uniref:DinB family protein n=1 Tax=Ramlibacter tataouinensis TaxID=94132 RepID=UPI0022F39921|nr:DinB family protein [Ramlibacter tataouinensis]WBY01019.1 DinB family protein [Ramlibacter tataouinensis]
MDTDAAAAFLANYRFLAGYNRWFNERLYDACERLPADERRRDRGAFFGSIHGTLNHLVWGDRMWLRRFATQGVVFASLTEAVLALPEGAVHETLLYEDWIELRQARRALDAAVEGWTAEMAAGFPLATMRYANTRGVPREHPTWQALTHFFNHQAHHRGQVTTLLAQAGVDPGVTDLIARV